MNNVHFMSRDQTWETPRRLFQKLDDEFRFTLDACALPHNAKVAEFFTPEQNGLAQPWQGRVWMNPPYGTEIGRWIKKAWCEAQTGAEVVVCLIPARTDTTYWHAYVMRAAEVRLIRGRVRFGGSETGAPFPSAVVVFRKGKFSPTFTAMECEHDVELSDAPLLEGLIA